ncbi:hypothetical protein SPRG_00322 [Saprolegnia parasitica CBS 223.65]|uniref:Uncharacterized protein n=1 Tax=Saprolegnia parasitica (strain CBS 223.65) TaxID=695850 RepID=A0A067D1T8_SAPPC|nr:hypothetical protein SPRG_00322 [Saprolegnia parasitica CBS 223.65]KDO35475.1 hypothetical protein SPRG_00322 [Saprolegnia parasitica CBS 223.65]|eukprot:XP_012193812.1 hypothetical protein SPRG_00322 [Saprolegnia parasitica CBS 223.65]
MSKKVFRSVLDHVASFYTRYLAPRTASAASATCGRTTALSRLDKDDDDETLTHADHQHDDKSELQELWNKFKPVELSGTTLECSRGSRC